MRNDRFIPSRHAIQRCELIFEDLRRERDRMTRADLLIDALTDFVWSSPNEIDKNGLDALLNIIEAVATDLPVPPGNSGALRFSLRKTFRKRLWQLDNERLS